MTHGSLVFMEDLIVLGHGHAEDDGRDVFEAVDPLFPLGPLPAHVEQLKVEVLEGEVDLHDARGFHSRPEDVLLRGLVVLGSQSV